MGYSCRPSGSLWFGIVVGTLKNRKSSLQNEVNENKCIE
jgi:hypothetical protein